MSKFDNSLNTLKPMNFEIINVEGTSEEIQQTINTNDNGYCLTDQNLIHKLFQHMGLTTSFKYERYSIDTSQHFPIRSLIPEINDKEIRICTYYLSFHQEKRLQFLIQRLMELREREAISLTSCKKIINSFMLMCDVWMNVPLNSEFEKLRTFKDKDIKIVDVSDFNMVCDSCRRTIERDQMIQNYILEDVDFAILNNLTMKEIFSSVKFNQNVIIYHKDFDVLNRFRTDVWITGFDEDALIVGKLEHFYDCWLDSMGECKLRKHLCYYQNLRSKIKKMTDEEIDVAIARVNCLMFNHRNYIDSKIWDGTHYTTPFTMEEINQFLN
jgi:uncharacterized protein Usg